LLVAWQEKYSMQQETSETQRSTEGMIDYGGNSSEQQTIVTGSAARIRDLVGGIGVVEPEFRIVDYGCGPGISAIDAVRPAIEAYRERSNGPLVVCHADQPGNDWNALFELAMGETGYASEGVRTEAAVGSFYDQMAPAGSVAFGSCFTASHWLRHAVRLQAPGTVWFADLEGEARAQMSALAQRDWTTFLRRRALELRQGGCLLVVTLGAVPDSTERNGAAASGRHIYRALQAVAQSMVDDRLIRQEVLDGFVFPLWFMTAEEARAPFEADTVLAKAFEIEDIRVEPAPAISADIFGDLIDDPANYAKAYTGYVRAFAGSTLRTQLLMPSAGNAEEADGLEMEFYSRLHDLHLNRPGKYAYELWNLTVAIRKTGG
jgi:hypothetical protein